MESDLIHAPLIRYRTTSGTARSGSLPQILKGLATGNEIESFPGLQPHQSHAWFSFLVQLAAIAMARARIAGVSEVGDDWPRLLLNLSEGATEPWTPVVMDLAKPALFQPPVPEGDLGRFQPVACPDEIDVLVTSKNHDVKMARIEDPHIDQWVFVLVSLQTTGGFSGARNYGVARMNGGFGNRPYIAFAPDLGWGARFRRDADLVLSTRHERVDRFGYDSEEGVALLWLVPWDGEESFALGELDPDFIEICRRIRLTAVESSITGWRSTSRASRIDARELKGNLGDPWTPIRRSDGAALTVSKSGFTYKLTQELLFGGDYDSGAAGSLRKEDPSSMLFIAAALPRGQGKTEGRHERVVPIPKQVKPMLTRSDQRDRWSHRSKERVGQVAEIRKRVLRPALCALFQGAPESLDFRDERVWPWLDRLDEQVDGVFFDCLWEDAALDDEPAALHWATTVLDLAENILLEALRSAPTPVARWFSAQAAAERIFSGRRRKMLQKFEPAERRSKLE